MKKNQITIHTLLSFFSVLGMAGVFSLLFCLQPVSAYDTVEHDNNYIAGLFPNDVVAVYCHVRKTSFSGSKTLTSDGNSGEVPDRESYVDLISLLSRSKIQAICSGSNLNCEFIACVAPTRAGPFTF